MAAEIDKSEVKFVIETVARGRTIKHDGETYHEGSRLRLPSQEADALRARGFLVVASETSPHRANGPTFTPAGGPSIGRLA